MYIFGKLLKVIDSPAHFFNSSNYTPYVIPYKHRPNEVKKIRHKDPRQHKLHYNRFSYLAYKKLDVKPV